MKNKLKNRIRKWLGIEYLAEELDRVDEQSREIRCYSAGNTVPQYSYMEYILGAIKALEKESGGKIEWHWVDDPCVRPDTPPQIKEWAITKKKKTKKNEKKLY